MNRSEWEAEKKRRKKALRTFERRHKEKFADVDALREQLRELEAKHAKMLKKRARLNEEADNSLPEEHVRCGALHHGCYICNEIAPQKPLPEGWVENMTGGVYFCPLHKEQVKDINRPTTEAPLHKHQQIWDFSEGRR